MINMSIKVKDNDRGWAELRKGLKALGGAEVKAGLVGAKADAAHAGGGHTNGVKRDAQGRFLKGSGAHVAGNGEMSVADIGLIHEFGTDKVPERSFIRSTFDANLPKYDRLLTNLERAVYAGRSAVNGALDLLGSTMASDMKARIRAGIAPALAALTVARKTALGRRDPALALVDTRQLINALEHKTILPTGAASAASAKAA